MRVDHDQVCAPWIAGGVSDVTQKSESHHFPTLVVLFFKALVSVRKIKGCLGLQENGLTFFWFIVLFLAKYLFVDGCRSQVGAIYPNISS